MKDFHTENNKKIMNKHEKEYRTNILKRSIGKRIFVVTDGGWYGDITGVKDEETFLIIKGTTTREVSMWDVRSVDN
jgi:preprotein translocase subunit YajC